MNEVYSLVKDEYIVLSEYINSRTKVKMKHRVCGYEYEVVANSFISSGHRCPKCSGVKKLTHQEFCERVFHLVGNDYQILGDYKNNSTKISMKHNVCDYTWSISPNNFVIQGQRCPKCMREIKIKNQTKTHEQFVEEVKNLFGDEYSILSRYEHNKKSVKVIHNKCGNVYQVYPGSIINGSGCKKCADKERGFKSRKTHDQFEKEVNELGNGEYVVLSKYELINKKVKIRHNIC
jgi:hypothetical protein